MKMIYSQNFCFQKYTKMLLTGQECSIKDLPCNVHLYDVITEENNAIMTYEFSFIGKTCTPKELISKNSKQT